MHRFFVLISLLICLNVSANEQKSNDTSKWIFSIGGQQNWLMDNG